MKQHLFRFLCATVLTVAAILPNTSWNDMPRALAADAPHQQTMYTEFSDLSANAWYIDPLADMFMSGMVEGTKTNPDGISATFSPQSPTTYGAFIKMLVCAKGFYAQSAPTGQHWTTPYYEAAKQQGIIKDGESYLPDAKIPRDDMALLVARAASLTVGMDVSPFTDTTDPFVTAAAKAGILGGKGNGKFDPEGYTTRVEAAKAVSTMLKYVYGANVYADMVKEYQRQYNLKPLNYRKNDKFNTYLRDDYKGDAPAVLNMPVLSADELAILDAIPLNKDPRSTDPNAVVTGKWFLSNETLCTAPATGNRTGIEHTREMVRRAKGSIEATSNFDYRFVDSAFLPNVMQYQDPATTYGETGNIPVEKAFQMDIADTKQRHAVQQAYFHTDTTQVYQAADGTIRVRGIFYSTYKGVWGMIPMEAEFFRGSMNQEVAGAEFKMGPQINLADSQVPLYVKNYFK